MLVDWKKDQDELREALGPEYVDYDLVFTRYYGMPTEASSITASFQKLIKENNLPRWFSIVSDIPASLTS